MNEYTVQSMFKRFCNEMEGHVTKSIFNILLCSIDIDISAVIQKRKSFLQTEQKPSKVFLLQSITAKLSVYNSLLLSCLVPRSLSRRETILFGFLLTSVAILLSALDFYFLLNMTTTRRALRGGAK